MLRLIPVMTLQQHGCVMFLAPTRQVMNVRPSRDSPHQAVIPWIRLNTNVLGFNFIGLPTFTAWRSPQNPSLPSGPPSAADWAAVSITVASEMTRHAPGAVRQAGGDKLRLCRAAAAAIATTKIGRTWIVTMPTATTLTQTTGMGGPRDWPCARPLTG